MYTITGQSISEKEQRKYIQMYQKTHEDEYITPIIQNNIGFIIQYAKKYSNNNAGKVHMDDIISAGYAGLVKAVDRFDLKVKTTFLTYAKHWIGQRMNREFQRHCRTVHIPKGQYIKDPEKYKNEVEIDQFVLKDYIEGVLEKNSETDINKYTETDYVQVTSVMKEVLDERELDMVSRRFGLNNNEPHTLEDLSQVYSITRERIRQIVNCALYKVQRKLDKKKKRSMTHEKKMHVGVKFERFN